MALLERKASNRMRLQLQSVVLPSQVYEQHYWMVLLAALADCSASFYDAETAVAVVIG
jgi:hypothetical protein